MTPDAQAARRSGLPNTEPAPLAPIAQAWRAFGLASLTGRHRVLLERAKRRELSPREKGELVAVAKALEALQVIAPEGAPVSHRATTDSGSSLTPNAGADIAHGTKERQ